MVSDTRCFRVIINRINLPDVKHLSKNLPVSFIILRNRTMDLARSMIFINMHVLSSFIFQHHIPRNGKHCYVRVIRCDDECLNNHCWCETLLLLETPDSRDRGCSTLHALNCYVKHRSNLLGLITFDHTMKMQRHYLHSLAENSMILKINQ